MRKTCLALVSKRNHPKKYQVSKRLFYKKQVYFNWFILIRNFLIFNLVEGRILKKLGIFVNNKKLACFE